jgi:uncharacterized membrane protein YdjX (TVP38/TMEM64 family)
MRDLLKPLLLVGLALAVPILPFAVWGDSAETRMAACLHAAASPRTVAALVFGLLATDVFLPVPSSVVNTVAGEALGFGLATAVSWAGLTAGAVLGFALARWFGRPLALRLAGRDDLEKIDAAADRFGPLVLVLARPVPVLAEASVLLVGTTRLSWRWFLAPVVLSNLGIAVVYSALGSLAALWIALPASIALPLSAAAVARRFWPGRKKTAPRPP